MKTVWKHKCDYCENEATNRELDPFSEEIWGVSESVATEDNFHYWCDNKECEAKAEEALYQSAMDI